jgi:YtxH-like protein
MRFKKRKAMLSVLIDTGLNLLDAMRERLPDDMGDLKDTVRDTYDTASDRVSRAAGALRGEKDSHVFGTVTALVIGVGIGVGIGLLVAPISGEETRAKIAYEVSDLEDKFREASGKKAKAATGADDI